MITADYINDLCTRSHAMAKEKGWWDDNRTPYELGNLCDSELSEALEELRDGHEITEIYFNKAKPTKPEGFPTELADFVIRLADWAGQIGDVCDLEYYNGEIDLHQSIKNECVQAHLHCLRMSLVMFVDHSINGGSVLISSFGIPLAFSIAEAHGIDLPAVIEQKMAYNATRPIRHGRKF